MDVPLTGNIYVVSEIEQQLYEIVSDYETNAEVKLTYARYTFKTQGNVSAEFGFSGNIKNSDKLVSVKLIMDVQNSKINKIEYNCGKNVNMVTSFNSEYLGDNKSINALTVYNNCNNYDSKYKEIKYENDDIIVFFMKLVNNDIYCMGKQKYIIHK